MRKCLLMELQNIKIHKGKVPFSVAEPLQWAIRTREQHLDSFWPKWNRSLMETAQILLAKMAAVMKVYCNKEQKKEFNQ